jgi:hypothetical protein
MSPSLVTIGLPFHNYGKKKKMLASSEKKTNKLAIAQTLHASFIDIYKFQKKAIILAL